MSRTGKQARRPKKLPLWFSAGLITVLGAAALALSYVAVTGIGSGDHPGLPVKTGAPAFEDSVISAPSQPVNNQPEAPQDQSEGPLNQRLLTMTNSVALRGTSGTCENPGTVEFSLDTGESWIGSTSLAQAGATRILRLLPTDPSLVQVVALDRSCEPQVYRTTDFGTTWEGPMSVVGTWYFDPSDPAQVGAPDGRQPLQCEGAELAPAGDRAAVRCADGSVVTTVDRGLTWSQAPDIAEVLAINYSPDSYVVAQTGGQTCEGVRLRTISNNTSTALDGCFAADLPAEALNPGNTAIAQSGNSALLWVGDDVVISTDGGRTWL